MEGLDPSRELSLYIHVPFCHKKCDYCAFYSIAESCLDGDAIALYLDRIKASIKAINKEYKKPYYTIFVGGGNPGIIGYENLVSILSLAEENGMPEEVTVELNPEDVTDDIKKLKPYVSRISVGIQSLSEKNLRTLGRNTNKEISIKALGILSRSGLDFNADIMTAIPGEEIEESLYDIKTIASFKPDHISLYCLSFEEGTPILERERPIGEDMEALFLLKCWKELSSLGYEHYEISNFARNGKRSLHNMVYWHLGQYIGLGPTAESSLGYDQIVSMRNTEDLISYINDPSFQCERLTKEQVEEEFLIVSLRCKDGIDKKEYKNRFLIDFDSRYADAISTLPKHEYINNNERFSLTEEGMMRLDRIILSLAMSF